MLQEYMDSFSFSVSLLLFSWRLQIGTYVQDEQNSDEISLYAESLMQYSD